MKKIFALVMTLALLLSLAVPAMADETHTVTINNTAPDHIYDAYQIFSGTLSGNTLSDVDWGIAIYNDANNDGDTADEGEYDTSAALIAALKADEKEIVLTATSSTTLKAQLVGITAASGKEAAKQLAEYLNEEVDPVDSAIVDRIAEIIGTYTSGAHIYLNAPSGTSVEDAENGIYTISNLPAGYYLIKDRDGSVTANGDFYTKYLIKVVGTQSIGVKGEGVIVEKFINDTVDGTYGDHEDFDIADTAYYMWQGSLPSNLLSFDTYHYTFVDELPYGLEFIEIEAVYIQDGDGTHVHTFLDLNDDNDANDVLPEDINLTVTDINAGTGENEVQHQITMEFEDLLASWELLQPDHEVVVKYSALVSRNALIREAMTNEVYLMYSNNPSGEGEGNTVRDYAHAFTFDLVVNKYDAANPDKSVKLEGAEFILYYNRIVDEQTVTYYAQVVTEEDIAAGKKVQIEGGAEHVLTEEYLGNIFGWTTNRSEASILDTDANGYLRVDGLDTGIYYLEETKAPAGYNTLNTAVKVEITAEYTNTDTENPSVNVVYHVDDRAQGNNNTVDIANSQGSILPTTGGIGTTLFYVFGAILVGAAVVLLVTKKRMAAQN